MRRQQVVVTCIMALVVLISPTLFAQEGGESAPEIATVIRVHDGDTITVQFPNGAIESVRFIGIDTPEVKDPPSFCRHTQRYGRQAKLFTRNLLMYYGDDGEWHGRTVRLVCDVSDRDDSHRLLRHVYLVQENGQELSVSDALLIAGLAKAKEYPPDTMQAAHFAELQRQAKEAGVGRWYSRKKKTALRPTWSERFINCYFSIFRVQFFQYSF